MITHPKNEKVIPHAIGKYIAQLIIVLIAYFVAGKLGQATTAIRSGNIGPYGLPLGSHCRGLALWLPHMARNLRGGVPRRLLQSVPFMAALARQRDRPWRL